MKDYVVDVFTGDVSRAGTNADVFITVYGDLGDSGEKKLIKSDTHADKFERNQVKKKHKHSTIWLAILNYTKKKLTLIVNIS